MSFPKPTDEQLANRFKHHPPKPEFGQAERYTEIRAKILETAKFCRDRTPSSPEQTRAINALHDAMMLFNASIAINE
jgi:hypothetical protein